MTIRVTRSVVWSYDISDEELETDYIDSEGNLMTVEQVIAFEQNPSKDWVRESIEWTDEISCSTVVREIQ